MPEKSPVTVISYISDRGALVHIKPEHVPVQFDENKSFIAQIEVGSGPKQIDTFDFAFEFQKETPSATGRINPAVAIGMIEGLTKGPPSFDYFRIKNVRENTVA